MKNFAQLFRKIDGTNKTNEKVSALVDYFNAAASLDKLWTVALFSHKRPKRTVNTRLMREWASEAAGIPIWLFEESYRMVGDLAETIALVLPETNIKKTRSLSEWIEFIRSLSEEKESEKKRLILQSWSELSRDERFLFNKLITGGFRVGISQKLMTRALAKHLKKEETEVAHRLMGNWTPISTTFEELLIESDFDAETSKPYPFYLAYALEAELSDLGSTDEWSAEWKWDGIRSQLIKRNSEVFLWSRGEDLITHSFPEIRTIAEGLEDGPVIDGELLPFLNGKPLSFQALQKRLGRKTVNKKLLTEVPVVLMAYDLLEYKSEDIRSRSLKDRRKILLSVIEERNSNTLFMSETVSCSSWEMLAKERKRCRSIGAEGFMLKKLGSPYLSGRKKGAWWKWKVDPFTIDAILLYAQRGQGRSSSLYTDFTFAVWDEDRLVTFTKAGSGLTDQEFFEVAEFVKNNTKERFGPVRSVNPELVFELAFEGIQESKRHKSGISLRSPRIMRWRKDKPAKEANTLGDLKDLLKAYTQEN